MNHKNITKNVRIYNVEHDENIHDLEVLYDTKKQNRCFGLSNADTKMFVNNGVPNPYNTH